MAKVVGMFEYCPELIKKNTYTAAQGRATSKWMKKNKDNYNKYQRERHAHLMRTNLDYRNMKAKANKVANEKRKKRIMEHRISIITNNSNISDKLNNKIIELKEEISEDEDENFSEDDFFSEDDNI